MPNGTARKAFEMKLNIPEQISWATLALCFGDDFVSDFRQDVNASYRWADDGGPCLE